MLRHIRYGPGRKGESVWTCVGTILPCSGEAAV